MKSTFTLLILLCVYTTTLFAQNFERALNEERVGSSFGTNNSNNPCITPQEYLLLENQCKENIKLLGLESNIQSRALTTSLNWPIQAASGFTDCDYYFIGAYVDQNTSTGVIQDYDCGTNTYDGHHGTDIAAWPYGFYKMENNQVEVIAAAPGTIIQKADGNFDRNCSSNSLTANSIIIQHADGTEALYWHMKNNSVTTKLVGQTVVAGEYLGIVGSSGSSSGPHLHFEVWSGSTNTTYNDPFSGACNTINASSWWNVQKPHTNSAVIKVSTNTTDIALPGCPTTETPNEADTFAIPFQGLGLSPGYAKFYIFIRDDVSGLSANCEILNPNGSTFSSWTYTSTANNKTYIRGYSKLLPTISGTYTFRATYNGLTCSKNFEITQLSGISTLSDLAQLQVLQNPVSDHFTLTGEGIENGKYNFKLSSITGNIVLEESIQNIDNSIHHTFSVSEFSNGIYFLTIEREHIRFIRKIIVHNQ